MSGFDMQYGLVIDVHGHMLLCLSVKQPYHQAAVFLPNLAAALPSTSENFGRVTGVGGSPGMGAFSMYVPSFRACSRLARSLLSDSLTIGAIRFFGRRS